LKKKSSLRRKLILGVVGVAGVVAGVVEIVASQLDLDFVHDVSVVVVVVE
jgi:hypothetical protein